MRKTELTQIFTVLTLFSILTTAYLWVEAFANWIVISMLAVTSILIIAGLLVRDSANSNNQTQQRIWRVVVVLVILVPLIFDWLTSSWN